MACAGGGGGAGGFRLSNSVGCIPAPTMSPLVAPNSPSPAGLPVSVQGYPQLEEVVQVNLISFTWNKRK